MTDRTHPDSGFPIAHSHYATYAEYVEALHARIAELESQLEAIGAGGVGGPLMGQPQEMPDLTTLTERGAKAWAGVDAQGLRDGVASAGSEPVAWVDSWTNDQWIDLAQRHANADWDSDTPDGYLNAVKALCNDFAAAHPSPPEGMVGGWTKASQQLPPCRDDRLYLGINNAGFAGVFNAVTDIAGDVHCHYETAEESIDVMSGLDLWQPFTPPTSSADSRKGE